MTTREFVQECVEHMHQTMPGDTAKAFNALAEGKSTRGFVTTASEGGFVFKAYQHKE